MRRTDCLNKDISGYLNILGIKHEILEYGITVDRTSMVNLVQGLIEGEAYEWVLMLVKDLLRDEKVWVCWGGRTDEWLGLEVYAKDPE